MSCLLLAFCNPFWLVLLVLLSSISIIMPIGAGSVAAMAVASAPVIALLLTTTWLERVSEIFKQAGTSFKYALALLLVLVLLGNEAYFNMIAVAGRGFSGMSTLEASALLSLVTATLLYASIAALLISSVTLIMEMSVRLLIGTQARDFSHILEGLRALLLLCAGALCADTIVELLTRGT